MAWLWSSATPANRWARAISLLAVGLLGSLPALPGTVIVASHRLYALLWQLLLLVVLAGNLCVAIIRCLLTRRVQ